jgi:hypothetical protein
MQNPREWPRSIRFASASIACAISASACGKPEEPRVPAADPAREAKPSEGPSNEAKDEEPSLSAPELLGVIKSADASVQPRLAAQGLSELPNRALPEALRKALSFAASRDADEAQVNKVAWEAVADVPGLCKGPLRAQEQAVLDSPKPKRGALIAKKCDWQSRGFVRAGEADKATMGPLVLAAAVRSVLKEQNALGPDEDELAHILVGLKHEAASPP